MKSLTAWFEKALNVSIRKAMQVAVATVAILLVCLPAFPQANEGTIRGSVFDQSGGAIVGATVTIIDVARGVSRPLTTDTAGAYTAPNLIPGAYTVRGVANGFQALEQANVIVGVGQAVRVDLVLQPGQQSQTVTVTSEAPAINTSDVTLGGELGEETVNELPLNGRDFKNLLDLRPGIVWNGLAGTNGNSANGIRAEDTGYLVDGLRADEAYTGNPAINSPVPNGDAATLFPVDAIQDMNVEENPKAEFGWRPGAIVNMGLKSGSNTIHGDAFAFGQDAALEARNFFDTVPLPKPPVSLEQYGVSAGGRIKKDKLFWFLAYEDQRYSLGNTSVSTTPVTSAVPWTGTVDSLTDASTSVSLVNACEAINAHPSAGHTVTPLSAQIAGLNPTTCAIAPTNYTPGAGESFFPTNAGPTSTEYLDLVSTSWTHNGLAKIDYHINDHNTINGMYFYGIGEGAFATGATAGIPGTGTSPFQALDGPTSIALYSGSWNWVPSSTRVNEFRIGYDHFYQVYEGEDHTVNPLAYGINTGVTDPKTFGFPSMSITGFGVGFGGGQTKIIGPDGSLQVLDHYSIVHGNHTFKFGGEFIDNKATTYPNSGGKGTFKFAASGSSPNIISNLENFLEGNVSPTGNSLLAGNVLRNLTNYEYALFGQDDWRVSRKITLNLGLRWEYSSPISEANNLLGNFSPTLGLEQVGQQIKTPYNGDFRDFEPRVGLAWDVFGNGKTVVRTGASLMYSLLPIQTFISNEQVLGIGNTPTGATVIDAACPAGCLATTGGKIAIATISTIPGSTLSTNWQAQTTTCVSGGTTACGSIFPTSALTVKCGDGLGTDPTPCETAAIDPNLRNGYIATWTFGIQRAITNNLTLDVSYVGTHGGDLAGYFDINQAALGSGFTTAQITAGNPSAVSQQAEQESRPYWSTFPYLNYINELKNEDRSNYNALQVTATQRAWHRWTFLAGFAWSHALDDVSTSTFIFIPADSNNPNQMYGNSDFDIRNSFTFSTTYELPGRKSFGQLLEGWQVNSLLTLKTSLPWEAFDTTNDFGGNGEVNNSPAYGEFWNFSGNPHDFDQPNNHQAFPCWDGSSSAKIPSTDHCSLTSEPAQCMTAASALGAATVSALNAVGCYIVGNSVLIPPGLGTEGDATRGQFRGPGYADVDFSLMKNWKFRERLTAQFRAEAFNLFNRPAFFDLYSSGKRGASTTNVPSAANFGCACLTPNQTGDQVVGTGGPRSVQLGLKLIF